MKIEMGESLCYSYLRHVKRCWLVQTNWKDSSHWTREKTNDELEERFQRMRNRFGEETFNKTKTAEQFLKQSEVDLVGIDQRGNIHAMEIAFHESGLDYGSYEETNNRVLKKMLRTLLTLQAYHSDEVGLYIYFAAPKVNPKLHERLVSTFRRLREEYPKVKWGLLTNDQFAKKIVEATLTMADSEADTTELFARSAKLLKLTGFYNLQQLNPTATTHGGNKTTQITGELQSLVQNLMQTLLVDAPSLLCEEDKRNLMEAEYCKINLGIKIGNLALIRELKLGKSVSGKPRYYAQPYGEFYVCSQWNKKYHVSNARSLLGFVCDLASRRHAHPDVAELYLHKRALKDFVRENSIDW